MLFAACDNDFESEFGISPDERAAVVLDEWENALLDSEHGWISHYYPNPELLGGFSYVFKFEENGTVGMNFGIRDSYDECLYSIKMFEKPLLSFDTYSIFSKMTDPEIGIRGQGLGGENEFIFVKKSVEGDTLFLEERIGGDPLVLVKASASDWEDIKTYPAMSSVLARRNEQIVPFYLNLSVEGWSTKVNMVYNDDMQKMRLSYTENGEAKFVEMPINLTHEGFQFHHALEFDGVKVRSFKYNEALNQFDVLDEGMTGAFKYETLCPSEIRGVAAQFFATTAFGEVAKYLSPKFRALTENLNPDASFSSYSFGPYYSGPQSDYRNWAFNFTDNFAYKGFEAQISEFEVTSENTVRMHFGHYILDAWNQTYSESQINNMMDSEAGQIIYNLLFSDKGWTIVPVVHQEYGSVYYMVSLEDPEMYMFLENF